MSHEGSPELPRRVVDKVLGNLQHLPDAWPLMRFDLMLHKSSSFYAIWRRFLHLNEYLRNNLAPDTANATIDAHARGLTEHLVEFLAEWILMALEPARAITKTRAPDFLSCTRRTLNLWVDLHQTMARVLSSALFVVCAKTKLSRRGEPVQSKCGFATCISLPPSGWHSQWSTISDV